METKSTFSAAIIGAGFFGAVLADYLLKRPEFKSIVILEKEISPLRRASANNQARIHQGFHYPRSIQTAESSRRNYLKFKRAWPKAVFSEFQHIYGIANHASKVSAKQFEATMSAIGAPYKPMESANSSELFDMSKFEAVYSVEEDAFNHLELQSWAAEVFSNRKIQVFYEQRVTNVLREDEISKIACSSGLEVYAQVVFNVTYSGLGTISGLDTELKETLIHEITEMSLLEVPEKLEHLGITVMDGPFFSMMPYPSLGQLKTLSHVQYTPVERITTEGLDPYLVLDQAENASVGELMLRSASSFIPDLRESKIVGAIREVKTILRKSSHDDSRPILFHKHQSVRAYSILGGKLDNAFDMVQRLEQEKLI